MAAVYGRSTGSGPAAIRGDGVQHQRSTRSSDIQALAFVMALFGLLLAVTALFGSPIA